VTRLSLEHCVDDSYLNFHSFLGWMVATANTANALVAAFCLVLVVRPGALAGLGLQSIRPARLILRRALASTAPAHGLPRLPLHPAPLRGAALPCALLHGGRATQRRSSRRGRRAGVARMRGARAPADGRAGAQVGRAKKCLDFAATLYLLHLAAVSALSSFPRSFAWCARARPRRAR